MANMSIFPILIDLDEDQDKQGKELGSDRGSGVHECNSRALLALYARTPGVRPIARAS